MAKQKEFVTSRQNRIKRSPGDACVQVLLYLFVGLFAISTVLPFLYVFAGSFATERELLERKFFVIPTEISLNAYRYIVKDGRVFLGLKNSVIVTLVGTIINMVFSTTLAYPLSRSDFRFRNGVTNMVIVTMLFSGGMVPGYILVTNILHLRDTYWALWLPGAMNAFNMIIIKNYFQGLPKELEEASHIDGASDLQIFVKVVLPLSKPVLASVSLFYAVGHWNAYFNSLLYISEVDMQVVQQILRNVMNQAQMSEMDETLDWGSQGAPPSKAVRMATTVVATVPILLVYPFIQKFFTQGVMVGAVKG
ncbi:MAG: carbohydrate ABC transporter permease [Lachnospiraceae bacterium]|nr:carbohydrate ABC transporter permease [Lachnospiraceae bacterium]